MNLRIHPIKLTSFNLHKRVGKTVANMREFHENIRAHVHKHKNKFGEMDFHGMGDLVRAKRLSYRLFWIFLLSTMTGFACFMSYKLVTSAVEGHTVTKIDYVTPHQVSYPTLTICDKSGAYFLNATKLQADNITVDMVSMILLKGPLWAVPSYNVPKDPKLQRDSVMKFVEKWDKRHPSPLESLQQFYRRYGVTCKDLFYNCRDANWHLHDCCELFKPIFHAQHGICYASDVDSMPKIDAPGLFSTLFIKFNRLNQLYIGRNPNLNDPKVLQILLDNGIDQGVWRAEEIELAEGHWKVISLSLEKITAKYTEKLGVASCDKNPSLEHFFDYTFPNCMWEWRLFKNSHFPLTAKHCQLPILLLTKLGKFAFRNHQLIIGNQSDIHYCSPQEIWDVIYRPNQLANSLYSGISYWLAVLNVSQVNPCLLPCEYDQFRYSTSDSFEFKDLSYSGFTLMISDTQYPLIREVETLEWWDYFALIGGAWGLWIGVSAVTVVQAICYCFQVFCHCCKKRNLNEFDKEVVNNQSATDVVVQKESQWEIRTETYQTQYGSSLQEVVVAKSPTHEAIFTQL